MRWVNCGLESDRPRKACLNNVRHCPRSRPMISFIDPLGASPFAVGRRPPDSEPRGESKPPIGRRARMLPESDESSTPSRLASRRRRAAFILERQGCILETSPKLRGRAPDLSERARLGQVDGGPFDPRRLKSMANRFQRPTTGETNRFIPPRQELASSHSPRNFTSP